MNLQLFIGNILFVHVPIDHRESQRSVLKDFPLDQPIGYVYFKLDQLINRTSFFFINRHSVITISVVKIDLYDILCQVINPKDYHTQSGIVSSRPDQWAKAAFPPPKCRSPIEAVTWPAMRSRARKRGRSGGEDACASESGQRDASLRANWRRRYALPVSDTGARVLPVPPD